MIKSQKYFAAIRRNDEGKEWIDIDTISCLLPVSENKAERENKACGPIWVKDNPVIRYAHIEIKEIKQP